MDAGTLLCGVMVLLLPRSRSEQVNGGDDGCCGRLAHVDHARSGVACAVEADGCWLVVTDRMGRIEGQWRRAIVKADLDLGTGCFGSCGRTVGCNSRRRRRWLGKMEMARGGAVTAGNGGGRRALDIDGAPDCWQGRRGCSGVAGRLLLAGVLAAVVALVLAVVPRRRSSMKKGGAGSAIATWWPSFLMAPIIRSELPRWWVASAVRDLDQLHVAVILGGLDLSCMSSSVLTVGAHDCRPLMKAMEHRVWCSGSAP
ncbi:hypothetical protein ACLOJK_028468 [Asimina triloba]